MKKKLLVAVAGAVLLAACGVPAAAGDHSPTVVTFGGDKPSGFWHGRVDGVECIVVTNDDSYNAGSNGISCNWKPK